MRKTHTTLLAMALIIATAIIASGTTTATANESVDTKGNYYCGYHKDGEYQYCVHVNENNCAAGWNSKTTTPSNSSRYSQYGCWGSSDIVFA